VGWTQVLHHHILYKSDPVPWRSPLGPAQTQMHTCLNHIVSQSDDQGVGPIRLELLPKPIQGLVELG
jgi:hypothetical protein